MCSHMLVFHDVRQVDRRRPMWRCSTCGRESSRPLDCCARPDFAYRQSVSTVGDWMRWLGAKGSGMRIGFVDFLRRWARPGTSSDIGREVREPEHQAVQVAIIETAEEAETASLAETPVGVGESE
jgi:hypothetical protein